MALMRDVLSTYTKHPVAAHRSLDLTPIEGAPSIHTSRPLFQRVLGNMVKNALEATDVGGVVRMGWERDGAELVFKVNNQGAMPREVQLQIFNRSFSTKGSGRGIGTHSIRLLGERYLGGRVSFESNEAEGTTFYLKLPADRAVSED